MSTTDLAYVVVILVLIAATGFLALSETALTRVNRVKAIALEEEHRKGAATLARLVEHPERFLNPILLMLLSCTCDHPGGGSTPVGFGPWGVVAATAFEVVCHLRPGRGRPQDLGHPAHRSRRPAGGPAHRRLRALLASPHAVARPDRSGQT